MTITLYLLKSLLALSILLLVYKVFLEKEKMHQFNRAYLIIAILLSYLMPILPTGMAFEQVAFNSGDIILATEHLGSVEESSTMNTLERFSFEYILYMLYSIVFVVFGVKFFRNIFELSNFIVRYDHKKMGSANIILLNKSVTPFTFLNYIFLNREEFERKQIDKQLIDHELAHVEQRHSWDILFIELLITLFWFNPVLRWYKTAIQLNHEFLADETVIKKHRTVKTYQYLLLDTIKNNNKISLASNINFHLTKKRLEMMTKKSSLKKKRILVFSTIPLIFGLMVLLGNPAFAQDNGASKNTQSIDKDKYFEKALIYFVDDGQGKVIKYKSLNKQDKAKIPPPPDAGKKLKPLKEGTIVSVTKDGNVSISNGRMEEGMVPPPPPPPKPPKAVKAPKAPKGVRAPKPPKPPKAVKAKKASKTIKAPKPPMPPPPPPPTTLKELVNEGATVYLNGKLATDKEIGELIKGNSDDIKTIDVVKNDRGKKSVYIVKK